MNIDLKASLANVVQHRKRTLISFFGNNLEGAFYPERVIEVHQLLAEVITSGCLHVVRHHCATLGSLRPKPNERNALSLQGCHRHTKDLFEQLFNRSVDRPSWKSNLVPITKINLLK